MARLFLIIIFKHLEHTYVSNIHGIQQGTITEYGVHQRSNLLQLS